MSTLLDFLLFHVLKFYICLGLTRGYQLAVIIIWNNIFTLLEICIRKERLRFWSDPDTELKLAKNTGVTVFRMGVDWSRIMPKEPTGELSEAVSPVFRSLSCIPPCFSHMLLYPLCYL